MMRIFENDGLTIVLMLLFALSILGQWLTAPHGSTGA